MRLSPPLRAAALALCAVASFVVSPGIARADTLSDYSRDNAALEQLVAERDTALAGLQRWAAAERTSLDQLAGAETKLHALLVARNELDARQPTLAQQVADAETAVAAVDAQRARLVRRVDAMEVWLAGDAPAPLSNNVRGYWRAQEALDGMDGASVAAQDALASAREAEKVAVDRLGQQNSEITWWQAQAETLAGQVGTARSRALRASSSLAQVQKKGNDLAASVKSEFDTLRAGGYPVGVVKIVALDQPAPIPEPVEWPATAPAYALPTGKTDGSLVAGAPLFTTRDRLQATGVLGNLDGWQAPVRGVVTTPFGDGTPYQDAHYAADIGTRLYAPIAAAADGVVEYAGLAAADNRLASYGLVVLVRHDERVTTLYAHLDDRANGLAVQAGDRVSKGQVIGYVGLTGYTTGPHLHFEVRIENQPIDPLLVVSPTSSGV